MIDYYSLGKRIREQRTKLGLTQENVATYANLANNTVSNIENGKTKVSLPTLVEIANCLQTSVDYLLYESLDYAEHVTVQEIERILSECNSEEKQIISETITALHRALNKK
ncbi:helix-turn-helix domain-containing protein [Holdemania massiliensis]|uniref:helix-turn-helix domain-containing protein n=1 Tax=Holdemania massiliensis TaxID=1468449 RepID=UPI001F061B3B|nr:helix-turn-helix transcriptional regulator [Holdemania massiliensis]MCH1942380.1 helix-turn-helix domain-containing protein [Holdemania massiliensis]